MPRKEKRGIVFLVVLQFTEQCYKIAKLIGRQMLLIADQEQTAGIIESLQRGRLARCVESGNINVGEFDSEPGRGYVLPGRHELHAVRKLNRFITRKCLASMHTLELLAQLNLRNHFADQCTCRFR